MLLCPQFLVLFNVCTAEKFSLSEMTLFTPIRIFGVGVYDNTYTSNGFPTNNLE